MWLQRYFHFIVTGDVTIIRDNGHGVAFKNCALFTKCITKIGGTSIDHAEELDLVMPMYNLIECISNYSETTGSLWFYFQHEIIDFNAGIANDEDFKSYKYKAKLLRNSCRWSEWNFKKCNNSCAIQIFK